MRFPNRITQSPDHTVVPNNLFPRLTAGDVRVLQLISADATNQRIAEELAVSIPQVEIRRDRLMAKLGIYDPVGLTRYAMNAGVVACRAHLTVL
jgi:DNA-binding NarL/FixJ family response regulator